jgi:hypothetical protein
MSTAFDMELFLSGVLTGSYTTRQRHLRQAKTIQAAVVERWQRDNPWTWQRKHLAWFLNRHLNHHTESTLLLFANHAITHSSPRKILAVQPLSEGQKTAIKWPVERHSDVPIFLN